MSVGHHIASAHRAIASGRYLFEGDFFDEAGRSAYMAAFHAALAYIVQLTGKEPKTHRGVNVEFARLAREGNQISPDHVAFLSHSYALKQIADYDDDKPVSAPEADAALLRAAGLIGIVERLLWPDSGTPVP